MEKTERIAVWVTEQEHRRIATLAGQCGLSQTEYVRRRALGYEPKSLPPESFYHFCERLDALMDRELSPEVKKAALSLLQTAEQVLLFPTREKVTVSPSPASTAPSTEPTSR